eukprot:Em0022g983a
MEQSNADGLSRLPVEETPKEVFLPGEMVLTLGALSDEERPVTITSIRAWTAKDPILARVKAWSLVVGQETPTFVLLQKGHPGITRMKALARAVVARDGLRVGVTVVPVVMTSSQQTIRELRHLFAIHGLPEIVVSDNGAAFSSTEFGCFMKHNGICHQQARESCPETPTKQEIVDEGAEETPVVQDENVAQ